MQDPILVMEALRLPQGRFGGSLAREGSVKLGTALLKGLLEKIQHPSPLSPGRLYWGIARSHTQGMNPARTIALNAGLGVDVLGSTLNMACASSLEAVFLACLQLQSGFPSAMVAGGSEAMSDTPHLLPQLRWGFRKGHQKLPDVMHQDGLRCPLTGLLMGETIEHLAQKHGVTREEADLYALESHRRAALGDFSREIVVHPKLDHDECLRRRLKLEELQKLRAVFSSNGQITAGNASALSDGAALLLLARPDQAGSQKPLARILAFSEAGIAPIDMGEGPVHAVRNLLDQTGLKTEDIDLWELNEAFAAQVLCCAKALDLPLDRLNVAGGGISLGHPIGASGARILVTLIHQLRLRKKRLGIATLGIGGGLGQAVLVEAMD